MSALDFTEMAEWDGEQARPEPSPTRYVLASVTGYSFTQTSKSPSGPKMVATDYSILDTFDNHHIVATVSAQGRGSARARLYADRVLDGLNAGHGLAWWNWQRKLWCYGEPPKWFLRDAPYWPFL